MATALYGSDDPSTHRRDDRRDGLARDGVPGAVLTRVASPHRVGTFQFPRSTRGCGCDAATRRSVIARHYPEAVDATNRYRTLAEQVSSRIFPHRLLGEDEAIAICWGSIHSAHVSAHQGVLSLDN